MAKAFNKLKAGIGLLEFITLGKYKGCRVDSIVIDDPDYLKYMHREKFLTLDPSVLELIEYNASMAFIEDNTPTRFFGRSILATNPNSYFDDWVDDIPF